MGMLVGEGKNIYQTYEGNEARSLIYQKYLLSEDVESKLEYLFVLEELFKKDNLQSAINSDDELKIDVFSKGHRVPQGLTILRNNIFRIYSVIYQLSIN